MILRFEKCKSDRFEYWCGFVMYTTKIMPSEIFFSQAIRIVLALLVNPI